MSHPLHRRLALACMLPLCTFAVVSQAETVHQPNILLIVADDLGFSDLSALGSEIPTPHIDALMREGKLLTDFHAAPSCSPTRAMLMSGNDPHLAGVGMMNEYRERLPHPEQVRPGYEGVLGANVATLAEQLRDAGYQTSIAGKWHLGKVPELQPQNRGFQNAWVLLEGGAAHFKQANMSLLPNYSYTWQHNGQPIDLPDNFYSATWFTDRLIDAVDTSKQAGKPFFAFAAYTSPHWPLQAPDKYLARNRGHYDQGYEVIARERIARQRKLGLVPADYPADAQLEGVPAWSSLTPEQKQQSARTMEVYAAMIEALDDEVGRLVEHLRKNGQLDDTLIFFMSDNGPESANRADPEWVAKNFDNRLDNYGKRDSFLMLGPAWAQVSALPSRRYKMTSFEGGIRVPAAVRYPKMIQAGRSDAFASARDMLPTLLELAGAPQPTTVYRGRPVLLPQGSSQLAWWQGQQTAAHDRAEPMGWEVNGHAALRKGDLKLVFDKTRTPAAWQLFDLKADPGEHQDLASQRPDDLARLLADWRRYALANNIAIESNGLPQSPPLRQTP